MKPLQATCYAILDLSGIYCLEIATTINLTGNAILLYGVIDEIWTHKAYFVLPIYKRKVQLTPCASIFHPRADAHIPLSLLLSFSHR